MLPMKLLGKKFLKFQFMTRNQRLQKKKRLGVQEVSGLWCGAKNK